MILKEVNARKILNSRKEDTIAVRVKTLHGTFESSAPAGASKGQNEVYGFSPKGVDFSVSFINALGHMIVQKAMTFDKFEDLEKIEEIYRQADKTKRLELLGGNPLYALQSAVLKAIAASYKLELWQFLSGHAGHLNPVLPNLLGNCIGGGKHTKEIEKPDFQEFLILPKSASGKVFDNQYLSLQAYKEVKRILKEKDKLFYGKITDEHAFLSSLDNESILQVMQEVKAEVEKKFRGTIDLGLDIAASSFYDYKTEKYHYMAFSDDKSGKVKDLSPNEQVEYIFGLIKKYNLSYVEDPIDENDFQGFAKLLKKVKDARLNTMIVGDDLICTNHELLEKAIKHKSINAAIIKPNQCGSLIETRKVVDLAKKNNITPVVSHRSGETCDNTIAHLAVGWQIPIIKIGIAGKERFAKTNELVRIERKFVR